MTNKFNNVVLASASPRRKELLRLIFENFDICISNVDESLNSNVSSFKQPEHLAFIKGDDVAKSHPESLVVAADTCVFCGEEILGKPKDDADAFRMLKMLSGITHKVITGCALFYKGKVKTFSVVTEVEFYPLTDSEIINYIKTGDCNDKAGSYGIQTKGGLFVKEIRGDYFNVVGLPIAELYRQITNF